MNIRKLGSKGQFYHFDDDDCAWCEAAEYWGKPGAVLHLENDLGGKRTVTCENDDRGQLNLECEPYVFFTDYR